MSDAEKEVRRIGRDEMNLCEFPIALLTDYPPEGAKMLVFEDRHGKLTVVGSEDRGLPTATDSDVIVGLIQLTKQWNGLTHPTVEFSRYELLKLLGWPNDGPHYRRLSESLHRWVGVTLRYDGCWWDNKRKRRTSASFHILDYVVLPDEGNPCETSSFAWNKIFFESCRDGNIKRLDLDTYFALNSAVSKQLYRFLDKRFYIRDDWTFDLPELAFEHVGMSRNYAPWKIKQKLQPALEELEGIGFLEAMTGSDRYSKIGRGEWTIRLVHKLPAPTKPEPEPEPTGLERELISRGVTRRMAVELVASHPETTIRAKLDVFDWLRDRRDARVRRNPTGYLYRSIVDDYPPPDDFTVEQDRARRRTAAQAAEEQARRAKARARADRDQVKAYWDGLSPAEQARVEAEALQQADPGERADYEAETRSALRRMKLALIRGAYIERLLQRPASD